MGFRLLLTMFTEVLVIFVILSIVGESIYLYDTEDSLSVEFYDCVNHNNFLYCRRPSSPITLQRVNETWQCYHNGISHSFTSLMEENINVSFILHNWRSSIEKAEKYSNYIEQVTKSMNESEHYLCQCNDPQSFGKYCEYRLPIGTTFEETLNWELEMKETNEYEMQMYGDILCYTTLICDSGLLCLDWRDICDGVQQCMFGYDEENCDKLEFNECDDNEYRCMNGMCIPDEYFLDGEYDCMDMTDEIGHYGGEDCTFQQVSLECDDRMCLRNEYSCGDGQCIVDRLAFQKSPLSGSPCKSRRDQYYMCETYGSILQWTLPNGRCYWNEHYTEIAVQNRSASEQCIYFLKCALSEGVEKNCPSRKNESVIEQLKIHCLQVSVQYPIGAIIAPYAFHFYNVKRPLNQYLPDLIELNASIKCRGHTVDSHMTLLYSTSIQLHQLEQVLCMSSSNSSIVTDGGYDPFCHNSSQTFNKHSYNFIDVCNDSKECISVYRIGDGFQDCADKTDENNRELVSSTCSKIRHHRFRCSDEQSTCLPVTILGDRIRNCNNSHDIGWMGTNLLLSELNCNSRSKEHCGFIRQYVESSWNVRAVNGTTIPFQYIKKIPFRAHCDTFWNVESEKDEDSAICQKWWVCSEDQWQCRSGQCINTEWVLDGEWDCCDASDEEGIFISNSTLLSRNLGLVNRSVLKEKFETLYSRQPFWNICNFTIEFPCFPVNYSESLTNKIHERPCIGLEKIGDGHVDCLGGLDERNTLEHCDHANMLGYDFRSMSSGICTKFLDVCVKQYPNVTDYKLMCTGLEDSENCKDDNDFRCRNGTCAKKAWCNREHDCLHGEDEYYCRIPLSTDERLKSGLYRRQKESVVVEMPKKLNLPVFPVNVNTIKTSNVVSSTLQRTLIDTISSNLSSSLIAYECNRGVGIYIHNGSTACFCPEQYYGDKCQFHSDRVTLLIHLNLSQSNYTESTNPATVLKMLVLFLFENETLAASEFHVRPSVEILNPKKEIIRFLYSRSNESLYKKRARYFNRSDIIHEHPYSIRIEAYELNLNAALRFIGLWQYPIYFDYLPSFRLAKILRLTKTENIENPCSNNPCDEFRECHQLLNEQQNHICLCPRHFKGNDCSIPDQSCSAGFCSPNALCKPNYRGLLSGNQLPYCICPLGRYGHRCGLIHDQCNSNPCRNQGTCLPSGKSNKYYCMCTHLYHGKQCELLKQAISLYINQSIEHKAVVVQYFQIHFSSLNLILVQQTVFAPLPSFLPYLHDKNTAPEIIVAKQYTELHSNIYIISLQINVSSINVTTQLSEINRCINIRMLFSVNEDIFLYKYHHLCVNNHSLFCFFDDIYLCICDQTHSRVECFGYDHNLERCSSCFSNGQCLIGDQSRANNFLCLCPPCYYGRFCQFSGEGLSLTLHSVILQVSHGYRIIYIICAFLISFVGGITNYATIVTFKRPNLYNSSMGVYLLFYSVISQITLFSFTLKMVQILFDSLMNDNSCKIISYIVSISIRCSFWLISWIAIERVCYLLFPFATLLKKPLIAKIISFATLLIVAAMDVHEVIFYMKDPSGQSACIVNYPMKIKTYDRISVLIHYIIPFCIQILSITVLIILAARSRSRATNNRDTFIEYLKRQFRNQKELYITPTVIIMSGLPQAILSFSFSCIELATWQKHALLIAYFIAYAPQSLGFVLFVLPSTSYMKEFRATNLSKRFIFRWMLSNNKDQTITTTT